jgi:hypothetical protein
MKAKDIILTIPNSDACDAIDRGTSNLKSYFDVGEEIDQEVDIICDGVHKLKLTGTNTKAYKAYKKMTDALHAAHDAIDEFNDEWQKFYEDIPG